MSNGFINKVQILGNLGRDPEAITTQSGQFIVTFSVATTDSWRDKYSGERKERTEWHRVVIWSEGLAKVAEKYLRKGDKVLVDGKIATNRWTDSAGVERSTTEIHVKPMHGELTFFNTRGRSDSADSSNDAPREPAMAGSSSNAGGGLNNDLDDDIPFGPCWQ